MPLKTRLLIGTCSWTDPTLIESGWYPERIKDEPTDDRHGSDHDEAAHALLAQAFEAADEACAEGMEGGGLREGGHANGTAQYPSS